MVKTTDCMVSMNDSRKFWKKFTATPCPGKPTEGIECPNFCWKMEFLGLILLCRGQSTIIGKNDFTHFKSNLLSTSGPNLKSIGQALHYQHDAKLIKHERLKKRQSLNFGSPLYTKIQTSYMISVFASYSVSLSYIQICNIKTIYNVEN